MQRGWRTSIYFQRRTIKALEGLARSRPTRNLAYCFGRVHPLIILFVDSTISLRNKLVVHAKVNATVVLLVHIGQE